MIVRTQKAVIRSLSGPEVWDRLWQSAPDELKEARRLEKERRGRRWDRTRRFLTQSFGAIRGLKTIELGSGQGDLSFLLAEEGAHVTLLDYSDRALERAARRMTSLGHSAALVKADFLHSLDDLAGRFDVALSVGVIEHFRGEDRSRALAAHAWVVRCGGAVMLTVPHALCPTYRLWKAYLELRHWWPYGMEIPYTRRELTRRARRVGLRELRCETYGFRESLSDHVGRQLLRCDVAVDERGSVWDRWFGAVLMLTGRKA